MKPMQKLVLYAALGGLLGLVFALYARPDFVMNLSNQIWGCF
jgi:hypothetical protein